MPEGAVAAEDAADLGSESARVGLRCLRPQLGQSGQLDFAPGW